MELTDGVWGYQFVFVFCKCSSFNNLRIFSLKIKGMDYAGFYTINRKNTNFIWKKFDKQQLYLQVYRWFLRTDLRKKPLQPSQLAAPQCFPVARSPQIAQYWLSANIPPTPECPHICSSPSPVTKHTTFSFILYQKFGQPLPSGIPLNMSVE